MDTTTMLVSTTEGFRDAKTQNIVSTDAKAVAAFCQKNCLTMGFSTQVAVNPTTGVVVKVFKKGKLVQRDVKPLIEAGFTEFLYSWAFSGNSYRLADGRIVGVSTTVDLTKDADIQQWARALGA